MTTPKTLSLDSLSRSELSTLFDSISTIVFDCDGVLYSGGALFPFTVPCIQYLSQCMKKRIIFLTNNDTASRREYRSKFQKMGLNEEVLSPECIYTSGSAAAKTLRKHLDTRRSQDTNTEDSRKDAVFMIGSPALKEELELQGILCIGEEFGETAYNEDAVLTKFEEYSKTYHIRTILLGYDRSFNLFKLAFAILCLRQIPECEFWSTASDSLIPWGKGVNLPGIQPLVRSIEVGSEHKVDVVCGKPSTFIITEIMEEYSLKAEEVIMIGDQLETDVPMANRAGVHSIVVLSGVCDETLLEQVNSSGEQHQEQRPEFVVQNIGVLHELLMNMQST